MKTKITDGLQVLAALLFTGSTAFAMQPPVVNTVDSATTTVKEQKVEPVKIAVKPQEKPAKASEKKKAVTWRDNPKKCNQDTQFIAKEAPFKCIDKPVHTASAAPSAAQSAFKPSGNKESWLRQAGIPESDWPNVDYIVSRESGWDPCAYNPGLSDCSATPVNACGLVQQNPCHKIPGDWRDPVVALKWQKAYVCQPKFNGYAGSTCYARAVSYWKANGNY